MSPAPRRSTMQMNLCRRWFDVSTRLPSGGQHGNNGTDLTQIHLVPHYFLIYSLMNFSTQDTVGIVGGMRVCVCVREQECKSVEDGLRISAELNDCCKCPIVLTTAHL